MKAELDRRLCAHHPRLFRNRHSDRMTTMTRGFECGDGWFDLIDVLSFEIDRYADDVGLDVTAVQVKEKFGSLRFYERGGDAYVRGLTEMAMALSEQICEECGQPGTLSGQGWRRTLCPDHGGPALPEGGVEGSDVLVRVDAPRWRHLARALNVALERASKSGGMPPVVIDEIVEGDDLSFRWHGGDADGHARAFFRLVEAYAAKVR